MHQTNGDDKAPVTNGVHNGAPAGGGHAVEFGSKRRRVGGGAAGGAAHRRITSQQAASNAPV